MERRICGGPPRPRTRGCIDALDGLLDGGEAIAVPIFATSPVTSAAAGPPIPSSRFRGLRRHRLAPDSDLGSCPSPRDPALRHRLSSASRAISRRRWCPVGAVLGGPDLGARRLHSSVNRASDNTRNVPLMTRRIFAVLVAVVLAAIGTGAVLLYVRSADARALEGKEARRCWSPPEADPGRHDGRCAARRQVRARRTACRWTPCPKDVISAIGADRRGAGDDGRRTARSAPAAHHARHRGQQRHRHRDAQGHAGRRGAASLDPGSAPAARTGGRAGRRHVHVLPGLPGQARRRFRWRAGPGARTRSSGPRPGADSPMSR